MNRRKFLKLSVVVSTSVLLNLSNFLKFAGQSTQVRSGDLLFKGNSEGEIVLSKDFGATWQVHTSFAQGVSIIDLTDDMSGQIYAQLAFSGYSFQMKLAQDGLNWQSI